MLERDEEGMGALERTRFEYFVPNVTVYIQKAIVFKILIFINDMYLHILSFVRGIDAGF